MRKKINKLFSGFSLVEILGVIAIVAAVATISVVSIKDSVLAGQRAAVQRELQTLNSALQAFKGAGGVIAEDASARRAVDTLKDGTALPGSTYAPLVNDPMMSTRIGDQNYNLVYDPEAGFSYQDGDGEGLGLGGTDLVANDSSETYPFDITDPDAVAQALSDFALLDPTDPEYADYLSAFAAAVSAGTLPTGVTEDILGTMDLENLVYDPDTLSWVPSPNVAIADQVQDLLSAGGTWGSLTPEQQAAYANVYPAQAVEVGGATALNIMDSSRLNAQLVAGYGNVGGTWQETTAYVPPLNMLTSGTIENAGTAGFSDSKRTHLSIYADQISGWSPTDGAAAWDFTANQPPFEDGATWVVYMATDPTQPAIPLATMSSALISGRRGPVESWTTKVATSTPTDSSTKFALLPDAGTLTGYIDPTSGNQIVPTSEVSGFVSDLYNNPVLSHGAVVSTTGLTTHTDLWQNEGASPSGDGTGYSYANEGLTIIPPSGATLFMVRQ